MEQGKTRNAINFSFIIPIYNAEKYIYRCMKSITRLTRNDIEIICIDDGSQDNSGLICENMAKTDARVRYFHKENSGVSDARNMGINKASGRYIIFIDSDDVSTVTEDFLNYCIKNPADCTVFGYTLMTPFHTFNRIPQKTENIDLTRDSFSTLLKDGLISSSINKVYCINLINRWEAFPSGVRMGEDYIFNINYLSRCNSVRTINKSFYKYIVNDESAIGNVKSYSPEAACQMIDVTHTLYMEKFGLTYDYACKELHDFCETKILNDLFAVLYGYKGDSKTEQLERWRIRLLQDNVLIDSIEGSDILPYIKGDTKSFEQWLSKYFRKRLIKTKMRAIVVKVIKICHPIKA